MDLGATASDARNSRSCVLSPQMASPFASLDWGRILTDRPITDSRNVSDSLSPPVSGWSRWSTALAACGIRE